MRKIQILLSIIIPIVFTSCDKEASISKPNIILLFADDMGYADVSCYGGSFNTPNIDQMAAEGMRFTDFYVPAPSCAPSRYALMTGCYPARNYVSKGKPANAIENLTLMAEIKREEVDIMDWEYIQSILKEQPNAKLARHLWGLPESELTIPEMLKTVGYKTMMCGKWHIGEHLSQHPTRHGFDTYYGVPASISIRPPHDYQAWMIENQVYFPNQAFFINDSIIGYQADSSLLTKMYTEFTVDYIRQNKEIPFFVYLSYAMPHIPIGASKDFDGKTGKGVYADVIAEIDWSVGEILKALKSEGLDKNTLVIFTSDNGPWLAYGDHAGSAKPLREGKGTLFEGGVREPGVVWWPGTVPAGSVSNTPVMTIDLLPTFAELSGAKLSENQIDGKSILPILKNPDSPSPQDAYYFFNMGNYAEFDDIVAVRKGNWKLMFPYEYKTIVGGRPGKGGNPGVLIPDSIPLSLFDLKNDVGEQVNLAEKFPEKVDSLRKIAIEFQNQIIKNQRGVEWITR